MSSCRRGKACIFDKFCNEIIKSEPKECEYYIGDCFHCANSKRVKDKEFSNTYNVVCSLKNKNCIWCSNFKEKVEE